jgi:hypothetical protein
MTDELAEVFENEWFIVRHSGETPEIAYNSAIYYLSRAQDGPQICLDQGQVELLKQAAVERYAEIVLRDLQHANCNKSIYRGISRSITNYHRFCMFCKRQQLELTPVQGQAASALVAFLETEIKQLQSIKRPSVINCTYKELKRYALVLGVELGSKVKALEKHCPLSSQQ